MQFVHGKTAYYTLPKDGEGQHAKWEQVFMLPIDDGSNSVELEFEGCQGGPIDKKLLAVSEKATF